MKNGIEAALQKGASFEDTVRRLATVEEGGRRLTIRVEPRCVPYLDHAVAGWVDGPPTSVVGWVLSGQDPAGDGWRRFTLSRVEPWTWELGVFPTPFRNGVDPLSPGIPPSSSRAR
jgi:hypothetical protein